MTRARVLVPLLAAILLLPSAAFAVREKNDDSFDAEARASRSIGVEVWTDRGADALYAPGDNIQLYVRANRPSYVAIYDIDTQGRTHLLYPTDPLDERPLRAGKTYRFPRGRADDYSVDGPRGVEYIHVVASHEPLYSRLPWDYRLLRRAGNWWGDDEDDDNWMYHVSGDPFVWCERLNQLILDDDPECGSGYVGFSVEQRVAYPRYLCNECHASRPLGWDPYHSSCSTFDVRVTAGWVFRPWGSRSRTCDPYYVYYRRDSCPPRYRELPRYWSSQERHRIREYFGPDRVNGPLGGTGGQGGAAIDKDADVRRKPSDGWNAPRGGDRGPRSGGTDRPGGSDRGGTATWKDGSSRDRGAGDGRRRPSSDNQAPRQDPKQAPPEHRSWINNLIRGGNNGKNWEAPERQPPSPRVTEPRSTPPPPPPPKSDPPRGKDGDRRSK